MSEIAKRPDAPLAPAEPGERKNPLRLLPEAWRQPVGFFYAFHSDLLKGSMGVVTRMRLWIKEDGLTLDEATAAMKAAMRPDACATFGYVGQLLTLLAAEVDRRVKARRQWEQTLADRADADAARRDALPADQVKKLLAGIGRPSDTLGDMA